MYEFSKFRFDPENHLLEADGRPVPLTPKAFEILSVLVENGSRLTTKEQLMSRVWPDSFVEEANLTVNISALRKQLGETPDGRHYIETIPKKGYRFVAPVSRCDPETAKPPLDTNAREVHAADSIAKHPLHQQRIAAVAGRIRESARSVPRTLLIVCTLLLSTILLRVGWKHMVTPATTPSHRHLAVLPFQNIGHDAATDFLGFSLADAVITKLGYVSELSVRPSYAVQRYGSGTIDIPKVAADLHVDTLLLGTYLRDGEDLRVACQLVDGKTQNLLGKWAFDLKYDKLLTVQDQVAQRTVHDLELTLTHEETGRLTGDEKVDPVAYEYYLRGVDLYSKADFPLAIKMLERSTQLAPRFAPAWAGLGRAYNADASFQLGGANFYSKAEAALSQALALKPDSIEARIYVANMYTDTGRVERAVPLLRDALRTNPNHAEIHWELGYAYRFAGALPASLLEGERARQIDPGVKLNSSALNTYLYLGQYDRFLQSLPPTNEVALIVFYRGLGEYYRKNFSAAQTNFDGAFALDPSLLQTRIGRAMSMGLLHNTRDASAMLHEIESTITSRGSVDPEGVYKVAQAYASIQDRPSALRTLRIAIEGGFFPYPYLSTDPLLLPVRQEQEYARLLEMARTRHERFQAMFF